MTIFTTWREIAGLTAAQIATLQGHSARCSEPTLQSMARECVEHNATQQRYAHIPVPAGAVHVDEWDAKVDEHGPVRTFTGSSWQVPVPQDTDNPISADAWLIAMSSNIVIKIDGAQRADGRIYRWVTTTYPEGMSGTEDVYYLPAASARMLSESLAAAADECERMNAADSGVTSSFPVFSR